MVFQDTIKLAPQESGATEITDLISDVIHDSNINIGTCQLFVHNSLSCLLIYDTTDEATINQTADFMAQLAPHSDSITRSIEKSMDSISEAMRIVLTHRSIAFPVNRNRPALGAWQGIFLWEKTSQPKERKLTITITGE